VASVQRKRRTPGELKLSALKESFDAYLHDGARPERRVEDFILVRREAVPREMRGRADDSGSFDFRPTHVTEFLGGTLQGSAEDAADVVSAAAVFLRFLFPVGGGRRWISPPPPSRRVLRHAGLPGIWPWDDVERLCAQLRSEHADRPFAITLSSCSSRDSACVRPRCRPDARRRATGAPAKFSCAVSASSTIACLAE